MIRIEPEHRTGADLLMTLIVFDRVIGFFVHDESYYFDFNPEGMCENRELYSTTANCSKSEINFEPVHISLGVIYHLPTIK